MNRSALEKLLRWMTNQGFEKFYVIRPENFAWLTGGGDNTVITGEPVGWLEIMEGHIRLHASCIETGRLVEEEVSEVDEVISYPWHAVPRSEWPNDLEHDLTPLRLVLSAQEQDRFRALGRDTARVVGEAIRAARPEWTERQLAGLVAEKAYASGIQPVVLLIAGEERIFQHRHPLPKDRPLGRLFMVVICGRRHGLVANLTRVRSFDHPKAHELYQKVLKVEAAALDATCPKTTLGEVLSAIQNAYIRIGRPEAVDEHHQGGLAGYRPREVLAVPGETTRLEVGMAVAWNPSLPGAKVEDTFLLTEKGLENLTFDQEWPMVDLNGRMRPDLLET